MTDKHQYMLEAADRHWQHFTDTWPSLAKDPEFPASCNEIIALSDFVASNIIKSPELLGSVADNLKLLDCEDKLSQFVEQQLAEIDNEEALHKCLRQIRNQFMSTIAWHDLLNLQPIQRSLKQVSKLADVLICQTVNWLYKHLQLRYGTPMGELGPQPLFVIGMGKLGGKELNFSSDIDLIFTYPSGGNTEGGKKPIEHQQFFTKLAQKVIAALDKTTVDGQVYRVDMRLRPFGESGPLVSPFSALEDYYQDQGRDWERYAMIKARVLNEDTLYSPELVNILQPFVFRRYLDYGAIEALRKMKGLIAKEVRRRNLHENIKLGAGGIREVEFIVQSFQLIRGGREPGLQQPGLIENLKELKNLGYIEPDNAEKLSESYFFLRKVEHCLQQFEDKQTQNLPADELNWQRLLTVMEFDDSLSFKDCLSTHMNTVREEFSKLIGGEEESLQDHDTDSDEFHDLWSLDLTERESKELLNNWLEESESIQFFVQLLAFKNNLHKKGMGQRGLNTLSSLMPALLALLLKSGLSNHSEVLSRVLSVFNAIVGRTTYLQLLNENHGALRQLIKLCAASPWISQQLSKFPILLDELLNPAQLYNPTPLDEYQSELRPLLLRIEPDDLELQMEVLRQFKLAQQLKIAAADVTGALPVMKVSDHLTFLSEAIIAEVVLLAWQQIAEKHGTPPGKSQENTGFAVLGYGKLGGIELGYGSDLDLVFVHNANTHEYTQGEKAIEVGRFYTKLAQRIMHLFNTKTLSGILYEIDMRLRPSGNSGLLVCHIDGFDKYQRHDAWTWEHQALVRARFICGEKGLAASFNDIRRSILTRQRDTRGLVKDVIEMREKMRDHLSLSDANSFDLKQDSGGIADIEFIVQFLVLCHSHDHKSLCKWSDNVRILESLTASSQLSENDAASLSQAYLDFRNTSHRLALQQKERLDEKGAFVTHRQRVSEIWQRLLTSQNNLDDAQTD